MALSPQQRAVIPDNYTVFERELSKTVETRLEELTNQLCVGTGVDDFASYRHLTGYVKAYVEVLGLMAQVRDRLNKLERGQTI